MEKQPESRLISYNGFIDREKDPLVPHANAFPSAMMSLGVLMGLKHDTSRMQAYGMQWRSDNDYNLHNGLSGEAFRFLFDTAEYFRFSAPEGAIPLQDCFSAIGTPAKIFTRNQVNGIDGVWTSGDELKRYVLNNLCDGYPVLLLGREKSDRVLLAVGFQNAGDTLIAWMFSPGNDIPNKSFSPQDCQYISNWSQGVDAVVLVRGEPSRQPEDRLADLCRKALARNEKYLREQRSAPYGVDVNFYDNWIAGLLDGSFWAANVVGFPYIYPEIWDLAERRSYGAAFLKKAAKYLHTESLSPAIKAGSRIHKLMWQINVLCDEGKKGNKALRDPGIRMRIVKILNECRVLDIVIADAMEDALR